MKTGDEIGFVEVMSVSSDDSWILKHLPPTPAVVAAPNGSKSYLYRNTQGLRASSYWFYLPSADPILVTTEIENPPSVIADVPAFPIPESDLIEIRDEDAD